MYNRSWRKAKNSSKPRLTQQNKKIRSEHQSKKPEDKTNQNPLTVTETCCAWAFINSKPPIWFWKKETLCFHLCFEMFPVFVKTLLFVCSSWGLNANWIMLHEESWHRLWLQAPKELAALLQSVCCYRTSNVPWTDRRSPHRLMLHTPKIQIHYYLNINLRSSERADSSTAGKILLWNITELCLWRRSKMHMDVMEILLINTKRQCAVSGHRKMLQFIQTALIHD